VWVFQYIQELPEERVTIDVLVTLENVGAAASGLVAVLKMKEKKTY
jgi:hypothetical protein